MGSGERLPAREGLNERLVVGHDLTLPDVHPLHMLLEGLGYEPKRSDLEDPDEFSEFIYTKGSNIDITLNILFFENEVLYRPFESESLMLRAICGMISDEHMKPFVLVVTDGDLVMDSRVTRIFFNSRRSCRTGYVSLSEAEILLSTPGPKRDKALVKALKRWSGCDPKDLRPAPDRTDTTGSHTD
jgi:hypothetical protein